MTTERQKDRRTGPALVAVVVLALSAGAGPAGAGPDQGTEDPCIRMAELRRESPRAAIDEGQRALAGLAGDDDAIVGICLHMELAKAYRDDGDFAAATEHARRAEEIAVAVGDWHEAGFAAEVVALIHSRQGELSLAVTEYERACEHWRSAADDVQVSKGLNQMATYHARLGDYSAALEHFLEALAMAEVSDDLALVSKVLNNSAIVYQRLGQSDMALEQYDRALEIAEELGEQETVARIYNNIAMIYHDQERLSLALEYFTRSLTIKRLHTDDVTIATTLSNIGSTYLDLGDIDRALEHLSEARALLGDHDEPWLVGELFTHLGNVYRVRGDYVAAESHLRRALEVADAADSNHLRTVALEAFSQLHEATGDLRSALEAHRRFKELSDDVFSEKTAQAVSNAQAWYEILKRQNEIELLKRDTELQELELSRQRLAKRAFGLGAVMLLGLLLLQTNRHRLAKEVKKLSIVARETDNSVVILDAGGRLEWANEGFVRLLGYTLPEFKKRFGDTVFAASSHPAVRDHVARCLEQRASVTYENVMTTKDGREIFTQTTLTPILDSSGAVHKLIAIDTDITSLKQAEALISEQRNQLQQSNQQLSDTNLRLRELNAKKNEFLGIAAHDLRAPLNSICGYSDLLLKDLGSARIEAERAEKFLSIIRNTGQQMLALIESLLDVAAIESGQIEIRPAPVAVDDLMTRVSNLHAPVAEAKGIDLTVQSTEAGVVVEADRLRIDEVLDNLVGNAIKFTPPGGRVQVRCEPDKAAVTFSVEDTGQGFLEDEIDNVFSGGKMSSRPTAGESSTGLGLVIVKKVIEQHRAAIGVDSTRGEGSTFWFRLSRVR